MRPENKVDLGAIQVYRGVIADIASAAIEEIEGVTMARNEPLEGLLGLFGVRHNSAVEVKVDPHNQISLVINVNVRFGMNLADTSRRIQDVVMTAVEKMADINLRDVDISIQGIERGRA
ncbi:MAG: Asp23/Gls24 family envelope stress response protein [Candidatus Omnitrophica bacterium]|nr:Asp23/Gls24 family envelope stress response protein [Candidatus Omnitrophota bacterium]